MTSTPVTVVASLASMNATLQGAFSDRLEPRDIGREATRRWTTGLARQISDDRCVMSTIMR